LGLFPLAKALRADADCAHPPRRHPADLEQPRPARRRNRRGTRTASNFHRFMRRPFQASV